MPADDEQAKHEYLFQDFEADDLDSLALISANVREMCGLEGGEQVHAGDGDEGVILWSPPEFSGLDNSDGFHDLKRRVPQKHQGDDQLWEDLTKAESGKKSKAVLSGNIVAALIEETKDAVEGLKAEEKGMVTASLIDRLANHCNGSIALTFTEFQQVVSLILADSNSKKLLDVVYNHRARRRSSKELEEASSGNPIAA